MSQTTGLERVFVALDLPTPDQNWALVERIGAWAGGYKIGPALFVRQGPVAVRRLAERGWRVFLDLKFHDIPNTVAASVTAACELGASLCTVHVQGGSDMLKAAADASRSFEGPRTRILGVTALTSSQANADDVVALAMAARDAGCDGVVCSALEAAAVREACGEGFLIVTPGIRFGQDAGDQARVATPRAAVDAGADFLVVGRPIYAAVDPVEALDGLARDLGG